MSFLFGGKKKKDKAKDLLKDLMSVEHPPIDLFYGWEYKDKKILVLYTPCPLHLLLGAGNDAMKILEKAYQYPKKFSDLMGGIPNPILYFYEMMGFKKGSYDWTGMTN